MYITILQILGVIYSTQDSESMDNNCKHMSIIAVYILTVLLVVAVILLIVVSMKFLKDKAQMKNVLTTVTTTQNSADGHSPQAPEINLNENAAYSTVTIIGTNL